MGGEMYITLCVCVCVFDTDVFMVDSLVDLICIIKICYSDTALGNHIINQDLYSLSCKKSYRQIPGSLEATRLDVKMTTPLWNLTGLSVLLPPRSLSNFRAIGKFQTRISWLRDFMRYCVNTPYRLVKRCPVPLHQRVRVWQTNPVHSSWDTAKSTYNRKCHRNILWNMWY